ncbi:MAG: hypothetical protein J7L69_03150 [Desulfobulbaceae bacterium]|nr:hypothetical protein [Desulfobulbaceae bacterium]
MEIKLGYLPHPQIVKIISGEHRSTSAAFTVLRVLFYYGTILQKFNDNVIIRPEFKNMYKTLAGAIHIDPYNMDAYYFAQAAFTWELGRIHEVNTLLEKGLVYRTWDYWLPFYLGFNQAYFLKDYEKAAVNMQRAAEISGNPLYANLASRYFYESEQNEFGLKFLDAMIQGAKSQSVKKTYEMRKQALISVLQIEKALTSYRNRFGRFPTELAELVQTGLLAKLPDDPYGGTFFLDEQGKVRTSSKFVAPTNR